MATKLDALITEFNKQHKEQIAARGIRRVCTQKIPFSSPRACYMTYGGLPRGRIIEFAGEENSGKTTTALDIVANAQMLFQQEWENEITELKSLDKLTKEKQNRLTVLETTGPQQVVYADCENTLDEDWASLLGVDVNNMIVLKPMSQTAEQIFEMLLQTIDTGEVGLVVIDSLGVMLSAQAYEKTMEDKTYGGIASALTLFSKKAELLCAKYNCTLIGINQMRDNLNSAYGGLTTTGGKAWKHNASLRLMFQKGSFIDEKGNELKRSAEEPAGNLVMMSIAKTKVCKPDRRTGFYTLNYTDGIDVVTDTVETALKFGIIQQAGAWFTFVDTNSGELVLDEQGEPLKVQGKQNVIQYLKATPDFLQTLKSQLSALMEGEQ